MCGLRFFRCGWTSPKTIKGIINKNNDQNVEIAENIETENSTNVDSFDADIIRRVVHDYYSEKQLPTLALIRNRLEQEHGMEMKLYKLLLELIKLGFKRKKK